MGILQKKFKEVLKMVTIVVCDKHPGKIIMSLETRNVFKDGKKETTKTCIYECGCVKVFAEA